MLVQLQTVILPACKYIQLRFRYRVDGSTAKVFSVLLSLEGQNVSRPATAYDLLSSVRESVLAPFLVLQSNCVVWETVSITYPNSRHGSKYDILKLPLQGIRGFKANTTLESYQLSVLTVSLRFQGRPLPKQVKVHGVCHEESSDFYELAQVCADIYRTRIHIPNCGLSYKLLCTVQQPLKNAKTSSNGRSKKKTTKKTYQYVEPVMCFWSIS